MRFLAIGDIHSDKLPEKISELLREVDGVICTGDLTSEKVLEELKEANKNLIVVKGNRDYLSLPDYDETEIGDKKIGVIHSHQFGRGNLEGLIEFAKAKNLDIIVFGHTHQPLIKKVDNLLLVNPGTATGTLSGVGYGKGRTGAIIEVNGETKAEIINL